MTHFPNPPIRLHLSIDYGGEFLDADVHEHEVTFQIDGVPASQVVAVVRSNPVIPPRVVGYLRPGELDLPPALLEQLVVACFGRLIDQMFSTQGRQTSVEVADAAEWLRGSLAPSAATAVAALARTRRPCQ